MELFYLQCNLKRINKKYLSIHIKITYDICETKSSFFSLQNDKTMFKHTWFQIHERFNVFMFGRCWYLYQMSSIVLTLALCLRVWFMFNIVFETISTYTIDFFVSKISTTTIICNKKIQKLHSLAILNFTTYIFDISRLPCLSNYLCTTCFILVWPEVFVIVTHVFFLVSEVI